MDALFNRFGWILNVLVIAFAGIMAGRTVSSVADARLAPAPDFEVDSGKQARRPALPRSATLVDEDALAAIFGLTIPDPTAVAVVEDVGEKPPEPDTGEIVPSTLNAELVATVEAAVPEYSLAVITDNTRRETAVYGVGDKLLQTATVRKIERRRVLVENNGRLEYLELDGEAKPKPRGGGRPPVAAASSQDDEDEDSTDENIKKVGENEYVIAEEEINKTLGNLNSIATQARIVPAFKNGVAQGFKLFSIRPNSLYSKIGIQNGDVIKRINGYEINSPDKALEIYSKLKEAREIKVELERRGRTVTKSYNIQ